MGSVLFSTLARWACGAATSLCSKLIVRLPTKIATLMTTRTLTGGLLVERSTFPKNTVHLTMDSVLLTLKFAHLGTTVNLTVFLVRASTPRK